MLQPLAVENWDFAMAAHLLNRAGFGGPPSEIQKLVEMGPRRSVAWLLDYDNLPDPIPNPEWAKPDPTREETLRKIRLADADTKRMLQQEERKTQRQRIIELKFWWLRRMASGARPLQEKMTLFWHGHFATSMEKVRDAYLMWRQNDLFRKHATGEWLTFLTAMAQDPAMMIWLDQGRSRKEHPNENFAREVMELFTLGEGHYTEKDVTEGARALTGWSYDLIHQEFVDRPRLHDDGQKTFLGRTGNLDGNDVLRQIVAQPQAARFITAKIWKFFTGQDASREMVTTLATVFRESGNQFKPVLSTMFNSEEFYSPEIVRNQVKSPVQWLVESVRTLERDLPGPVICFGLTRGLGQDLFAPPNVKGWDGGLSWITTSNLLLRYNGAALLVQGDASVLRGMVAGLKPAQEKNIERRTQNIRLKNVDTERILSPEERADKSTLIASLEHRLMQAKLTPKHEQTLKDFLAAHDELDDETIRNAIRLMMSTPEYQLT